MDIKNSSGHMVSLLNEALPRRSGVPAQPSSSLSRHTSHISSSSESILPQTPSLVWSDSGESRATMPSPSTPTSHFNTNVNLHPKPPRNPTSFNQRPHINTDSSFYNSGMPGTLDPSYPATPQNAAVDFSFLQLQPQPQLQQQQPLQQQLPLQQQQPYFPEHDLRLPFEDQGFPPTTTAPKTSTKKNSYPCPVAKQYACQEYFTTSGHAARHAKKHTGKKDAICPECNKAFTRKDNMEQHRRTHSGVRVTSKPAPSASSGDDNRGRKQLKVQQQQRKARPTNIMTQATTTAELNNVLDPALRESPMSYNMFDDGGLLPPYPQQPLPYQLLSQRPGLHRSVNEDALGYQAAQANMVIDCPSPGFNNGSEMAISPSLAPALDALALAASRQQ